MKEKEINDEKEIKQVNKYKATENLNTIISNPNANINDTMNVNIKTQKNKIPDVESINSPDDEDNEKIIEEKENKPKEAKKTKKKEKETETKTEDKKKNPIYKLSPEVRVALLIIVIVLIFLFLLPFIFRAVIGY